MSWSQLTMVVDAKQVGTLSNLYEVFLAQAVTTENAGEDEFYEIAFPGTPDWQKVAVTALFDAKVDLAPIIDFIHQQLGADNAQEIPTNVSQLVDQDWERVWLSSFKPIEVGKNLWVCPSWCEPVEPDARNIVLDPGLAFGTGTHATTHLCLGWLAEQDLRNQTVLDYGSGSGILAIAAVLSGAQRADAVDIDPLAVQACAENVQRNGLQDQITAYLPDDLPAAQYELVIANILAEVIIELRDTLLLHLAPRGRLLLTGILNSQAERVIAAFGDKFEVSMHHHEQWCLLVCSSREQQG